MGNAPAPGHTMGKSVNPGHPVQPKPYPPRRPLTIRLNPLSPSTERPLLVDPGQGSNAPT